MNISQFQTICPLFFCICVFLIPLWYLQLFLESTNNYSSLRHSCENNFAVSVKIFLMFEEHTIQLTLLIIILVISLATALFIKDIKFHGQKQTSILFLF
jgi:hypothetical protein